MVEIYLRRNVARSAAALSYYLTISVFPFLICVSAILGNMHVAEPDIVAFLSEIVPTEAFSIIIDFLNYVGRNRTELMIAIGVAAMVTSSSAAFRSFTGIMGEIQGEMRYSGVLRGVLSFILSIVFLAVVYISGFVIVSGEWLIQEFEARFGFGDLLALWKWVRFVLLFLFLFGIIFGVYILTAPKGTKMIFRLPGAFAASIVLVAASAIYSKLISASLRYALLYGSLASFIILMIWLYTCGIILIMANVFNISLGNTDDGYKPTVKD